MPSLSHPLQFVLVARAGWITQQQGVIDYLQEENRVLCEQIGDRRLRFTDHQRRRLAAKARTLGRRLLREIATIVTPDTLLASHRTLIAKHYDGSGGCRRLADTAENHSSSIHSYGVRRSAAFTSSKFSIISLSGNGLVLASLTEASAGGIPRNSQLRR